MNVARAKVQHKSYIRETSIINRLIQNKSVLIGGIILLFMILISILAPVLSPHNPDETNPAQALKGPSPEYPLGADEFGRCLLSRMLWGGQVTIFYSLLALLVAMITGIPIGLIAGYYKKIDNILMRIVDVLMAFPGILLAISIIAILGAGLINVTLAVGLGTMPAFARLIRASVLSLKQVPFVEASISAGSSDCRIIVKHILPNCISTVVVYSMLQMAWIIMSISTLSFLGIGALPPTPEWGALVSSGKNYIMTAPHISTYPVIFIFATVTAFNLVADGLRDVLDPRMSEL